MLFGSANMHIPLMLQGLPLIGKQALLNIQSSSDMSVKGFYKFPVFIRILRYWVRA